ncbi:MAG: hypothetical protein V7609_1717 [Verrucomicrobiota bacterium]
MLPTPGICSALSRRVNFYDVLADGYHTPLTKMQIAELFHAGRLGRNNPCKQVEKKDWRTIDELFPLLKYHYSSAAMDEVGHLRGCPPRERALILLVSFGAIAMLVLLPYFFTSTASRPPDGTRHPSGARSNQESQELSRSVNAAQSRSSSSRPQQQSSGTMIVPAYSNDAPNQSVDLQQARLAQERWNAEQQAREQTQAAKLAQDRANANRMELEQQKAAGRTESIPLDQFTMVRDVGGSNVTVKIHDHDITTIDVWTGYAGPVRLTKQKGITGSRTDETLIYRNGGARLYYVWEISGKLNHCLLRVRDD